MKTPERVSRMRLINRPSTVVIMPFIKVHTTPSSGSIPSTRERASIMESTLPPVVFRTRLRVLFIAVCVSVFAPEFVSGAANENVFQGGFADRERLYFSGEGFDEFGHKSVRAFALDANLILEDRGFNMKTCADALGAQACIARCIEHNHVAAPISAFISAGVPRATKLPSFIMSSRSQRSASSMR